MSEKAKQSKFEKNALALLDDKNDVKLANRSYRKAVSAVEVQIAQLNSKKVEMEANIDEATDAVEAAQFNMEFELSYYDTACSTLEDYKEQLEDINATLENRADLLKSWK